MYNLIFSLEITSFYKLGNDVRLISQRRKNPFQVILETAFNEKIKRFIYNSFIYNNR